MAKATNKTVATDADVGAFVDAIADPARREDARAVLALMRRVTGCEPRLWGDSIVGFDSYRYRYASGREGDYLVTGFAPRKDALSLHVLPGYGRFDDILARLGRHRSGKACVHVRRLDDVDIDVLEELIETSVAWMREHHETLGR